MIFFFAFAEREYLRQRSEVRLSECKSKKKSVFFIAFAEREYLRPRSATTGDACSEGLKKVRDTIKRVQKQEKK